MVDKWWQKRELMAQVRTPSRTRQRVQTEVIPGLVGFVARPGSRLHRQARALQAARFAAACKPGDRAYLDTVDYRPELTVPILVQERAPAEPQVPSGPAQPPAKRRLLGTLRLELPGASIIQSIVRFAPGSVSQQSLAAESFVELGGFTVVEELDRVAALDVV